MGDRRGIVSCWFQKMCWEFYPVVSSKIVVSGDSNVVFFEEGIKILNISNGLFIFWMDDDYFFVVRMAFFLS